MASLNGRIRLFLVIWLEVAVFGYLVHLVLSCIAAFAVSRNRVPISLKLAFTVVFLISVAANAIDCVIYNQYVEALSKGQSYGLSELLRPRIVLRMANSVLAQSVVASRCIQLWPARWVWFCNIALVSATLATGLYSIVQKDVEEVAATRTISSWTNLGTAAVQAAMIIGRTLWVKNFIQRKYKARSPLFPMYNTFIDAGVGYPILALIDRLVPFHPLEGALIPLAAVTTARIILQGALGRSIPNLDQAHRRYNHATGSQSSIPVLDTLFESTMYLGSSRQTIGIRQRTTSNVLNAPVAATTRDADVSTVNTGDISIRIDGDFDTPGDPTLQGSKPQFNV